jgi:hypothetical protein
MKTGAVTDAPRTKQCVCIVFHVVVAGVRSAKQAYLQKFVLRSTIQPDPRCAWKIKNSKTCLWRRPQNKLERGLQNTTYRKYVYKVSAHMFLVAHPISQPSLNNSPIWIPTIEAEVRKLLQVLPVQIICKSRVFMLVLHRICLFSVGFYFESSLILWILAIK